jgi:hypothetical protein
MSKLIQWLKGNGWRKNSFTKKEQEDIKLSALELASKVDWKYPSEEDVFGTPEYIAKYGGKKDFTRLPDDEPTPPEVGPAVQYVTTTTGGFDPTKLEGE